MQGNLFTIDRAKYPEIFANYCEWEAFFPLIGAVLLDKQDGAVYADDPIAPKQFFVEHAFGFAQIFGISVRQFEEALENYLILNRSFRSPKIRLYTPLLPEFLLAEEHGYMRSERCRFILAKSPAHLTYPPFSSHPRDGIRLEMADMNSVHEIEHYFGITTRFWRTVEDFIVNAYPVVAYVDNHPAAICYAAAIADGRAEIDVVTLPKYQKLGLGKLVVSCFNQQCLEHRLSPVWDCFTNNAGSIALCRSIGFVPKGDSYPFFTINKLVSI